MFQKYSKNILHYLNQVIKFFSFQKINNFELIYLISYYLEKKKFLNKTNPKEFLILLALNKNYNIIFIIQHKKMV